VGLIGFGIALAVESRAMGLIKSWHGSDKHVVKKIQMDKSPLQSIRSENSSTKVLRLGSTAVGLAATCFGIYSVASGIMDFLYPEINCSTDISKITHINGVSVETLEKRMRPCAYQDKSDKWSECAGTGFIGKDESLLNLIDQDTKTVCSNNLTHPNVATALETVLKSGKPEFGTSGYEVNFNNKTFFVIDSGLRTVGYQPSPFFDDRKARADIGIVEKCIANASLDELLAKCHSIGGITEMTVGFIKDYGFYEGASVPHFRIDPQKLIDFLGLKK
jgi:hypothetical protein